VLKVLAASAIWTCLSAATAEAQENYEIQVYPSETMAPGTLLVELHSNYTVEGSTSVNYGLQPTQGEEQRRLSSRRVCRSGRRWGFTCSPRSTTGRACSGSGITSAAGADSGELALAGGVSLSMRLGMRGRRTRIRHGRGR